MFFKILLTFIIWFYPAVGNVVYSDCGTVCVQTSDGNIWEYYGEEIVGSTVFLMIYNNKTGDLSDDIIIWARK